MVVHVLNPSTQEAELGGSNLWVPGQPRLYKRNSFKREGCWGAHSVNCLLCRYEFQPSATTRMGIVACAYNPKLKTQRQYNPWGSWPASLAGPGLQFKILHQKWRCGKSVWRKTPDALPLNTHPQAHVHGQRSWFFWNIDHNICPSKDYLRIQLHRFRMVSFGDDLFTIKIIVKHVSDYQRVIRPWKWLTG